MGLVALALVLGRPLHASEFPNHLPTLLNEARERTALGEEQPLSQPLRDWLSRALQLDTRRAFASAPEALSALEEIVADDSMYVAAPVSLETFLSRYIAAAPRAARRSNSRAAGRRVRAGDDVRCDAHRARRRPPAGGGPGGQPRGRIRGLCRHPLAVGACGR